MSKQSFSMNNPSQIIVFTIFQDNLVLVEKRAKESTFPEELLFPGGSVEESETLEQTFFREVEEETGIQVLEYKKIPTSKTIYGYKGLVVNPFLITKYKGEIPENVLDKGNPLLWVEFTQTLNSKIKPVQEVALAIKEFLNQ